LNELIILLSWCSIISGIVIFRVNNTAFDKNKSMKKRPPVRKGMQREKP
jgi:hypothetical protein